MLRCTSCLESIEWSALSWPDCHFQERHKAKEKGTWLTASIILCQQFRNSWWIDHLLKSTSHFLLQPSVSLKEIFCRMWFQSCYIHFHLFSTVFIFLPSMFSLIIFLTYLSTFLFPAQTACHTFQSLYSLLLPITSWCYNSVFFSFQESVLKVLSQRMHFSKTGRSVFPL